MWFGLGAYTGYIQEMSPEALKSNEVNAKERFEQDIKLYNDINDLRVYAYRESSSFFVLHKAVYVFLALIALASIVIADISVWGEIYSHIVEILIFFDVSFFILFVIFFIWQLRCDRQVSEIQYKNGIRQFHIFSFVTGMIFTITATISFFAPQLTAVPEDLEMEAVFATFPHISMIMLTIAALCIWIIFIAEGFRKVSRISGILPSK